MSTAIPGGYGALLYGLKHPDQFGRIFARSAGQWRSSVVGLWKVGCFYSLTRFTPLACAGRWPSNMNWNRLNNQVNAERARAKRGLPPGGQPHRAVSGYETGLGCAVCDGLHIVELIDLCATV